MFFFVFSKLSIWFSHCQVIYFSVKRVAPNRKMKKSHHIRIIRDNLLRLFESEPINPGAVNLSLIFLIQYQIFLSYSHEIK